MGTNRNSWMYNVAWILLLKREEKSPCRVLNSSQIYIEKALYLHINYFTRYYFEISFYGTELWYFLGLISSRHLEFTYHNVALTVFNYFTTVSAIQMTESTISRQMTHLSFSRSLSIWTDLMYHCCSNSSSRGGIKYIGLLDNSGNVWR